MTTMPGFGDTCVANGVSDQQGVSSSVNNRPSTSPESMTMTMTMTTASATVISASTTTTTPVGTFDSNPKLAFSPLLELDSASKKLTTLGVSNSNPNLAALSSNCAGCGSAISDSFYFRTSPDFAWHASCLSCIVCHSRLDAHTSCFVRNGKTYCKLDYQRLFGRKCTRCDAAIEQNEYVMMVKEMVFHTKCFACVCCNRPLNKGEHFALVGGASLYCQNDYEALQHANANANDCGGGSASSSNAIGAESNDSNNNLDSRRGEKSSSVNIKKPTNGTGQKGRPRKRKDLSIDCGPRNDVPMMALSLPTAMPNGYPPTLCSHDGAHLASFADHANVHHCLSLITQSPATSENSQKQLALSNGVRQKRMRTSFKHHQLRAMKAYFNLNHNPDARDLKQLSEKTGLSKRVLQVWFQNSRAKYRRSLLKQQQENGGSSGGLGHKRSLSQDDQSEIDSAVSRDNPNLPINPMDAVDQILAQEKIMNHKGDDDDDDEDDDDDDMESSKDGSMFSNNYESLCSSSPAATRLNMNVPLACNQPMTMFGCELQSRAFING